GSVAVISGIVLGYIVPEARDAVREERRKSLENSVGLAFSLLQEYEWRAMAGEFSREEAKARGAQRLSHMKYGRDGYYWITDTNLVMIMHPTQPELNGRNVAGYKDPEGTEIFREFASVCREQGAGFVNYYWPKPAMRDPVHKLSYVRLFEEWGWIVGMGLYTDDVKRETTGLYNKLFLIVLLTSVLVSIAGLLVAHQIVIPIQRLARDATEVAKGNYEVKLESHADDEVGVLASSFHSMVTSIKNAITEITVTNQALDRARAIAEAQAGELEIQAEELKAAHRVALEASRLKSEFLRNVTHEFRTPMNGVIGMNDLLLDTNLDEEQREYAETIRESSRSMMELIDQVLNFSRIESGFRECQEETIEFGSLIKQALQPHAQLVARKKLDVAIRVDDRLDASVMGHAACIREIFGALTSNAVKFTGDGGEICFDIDLVECGDEDVKVKASVRDTGIGIPVETIERLFRPFVQGDGSTRRKYGGTGLGLATSKQLVEMMGGQIGVESEEGKGSTFWFAVTLKKQASPGSAGIAPGKPGSGESTSPAGFF
ncbi:MAG: cache domain-containing protein, partial [Bacteroidetes bacterium]|nr:cache domain-containing protein [Bacteroidota bacterium]